jgi:hypothetical protein
LAAKLLILLVITAKFLKRPLLLVAVWPPVRALLCGGLRAGGVADVPDYNFNWQQFYMYKEPLALAPGSEIRLSCTYNTLGQVKTVTWGEGTDDEMCIALLYVSQ